MHRKLEDSTVADSCTHDVSNKRLLIQILLKDSIKLKVSGHSCVDRVERQRLTEFAAQNDVAAEQSFIQLSMPTAQSPR